MVALLFLAVPISLRAAGPNDGDGARGDSVLLHGVGAVKTMNPAGKEVVDIGVDSNGNGIVGVRHLQAMK